MSRPQCVADKTIRVNVMYDDFPCMDLAAGTSIIGFVKNSLVVCADEYVGILELRIS